MRAGLDFDVPEPAQVRQVHGDRIIVADGRYPRGKGSLGEADGLMTKVPYLPLAIRTADCLPVFMFDAGQEGIGLIHAGWRGMRKNILGQAVGLMERQWRSNPGDIRVALGPAIRPCCYEVGGEFLEYFPGECVSRGGRHYLDLPKAGQNQLTAFGVHRENIFDCGICTCCDRNYFSNRRDGKDAGRMISLMVMRSKGV